MKACTKCGAVLPDEAAFCSRCGTAVAAEGASTTPSATARPASANAPPPSATARPSGDDAPLHPPGGPVPKYRPAASAEKPRRGAPWWIVPAVIVGIIAVAWFVLAGMPFGGDRNEGLQPQPETVTIAEGVPQPDPGTVIDAPGNVNPEGEDTTGRIATTTTIAPPTATIVPVQPPPAPPPAATQTLPPPMTSSPPRPEPPAAQPPPAATTPPPSTTRPAPAPAPARPAQPPPQEPEREDERISQSEAASILRSYVTSRNVYGVASECVQVNSRGYLNAGYTFEVWHSCTGGGRSRLLGRWRVDAKNGDVFRQRSDGRYLRP